MINRKTFASTLLGILFVSTAAVAVCPEEGIPMIVMAPWSVTDPIRNTTGAVLSLYSLSQDPKQVAKIIGHQEETEAELGGGGEEESEDEGEDEEESSNEEVEEGSGSSAGDMDISAYTYVKEKIFDKNMYSPYSKLNGKVKPVLGTSGANSRLREIILEEFYIENPSDNTIENRKKIQRNRDDYLRTLGREYTRLSNTVQSKLADDLSAVVSELNGDGSIGIVSGTDQSWKAVNKALIVDLALQIEMMELEAARFLSVQPISLIEKPEDES